MKASGVNTLLAGEVTSGECSLSNDGESGITDDRPRPFSCKVQVVRRTVLSAIRLNVPVSRG